jgi:hypothetical protein
VSPRTFNVALFVADFVTALDRLQRWTGSRPGYPTEPWHRALREAESADARRLIATRYAELDAGQRRVRYCERLSGSTTARMNGSSLGMSSVESEIPESRCSSEIRLAGLYAEWRAVARIGESDCESIYGASSLRREKANQRASAG